MLRHLTMATIYVTDMQRRRINLKLVTLVLLSGFWSVAAAMVSSTSLQVSGVVPLVLQASVIRESNLSYAVHEISNSRDGYVVTLETDAASATYEGQPIQIVEGQAIITRIATQDRSIDTYKQLVFKNQPEYVRLTISVN